MTQKVYTKKPRAVRAVFFFGQGQFRRIRDGVLSSDPDRQHDPVIVMESSIDVPLNISLNSFRKYSPPITTELTENGRLLARTQNAIRCTGRRRPDMDVYIVR